MKEFNTITFDPAQCRKELDRLGALLASKQELSERHDLQPLFKESPQLAAFMGTSIPDIGLANRLAFEFQIFGDYAADIVIGNFERKTFCAIELEDALPNSIFSKPEGKATSEWGRRFEHGFGQLVDWFFSFDDHKNSAGFLTFRTPVLRFGGYPVCPGPPKPGFLAQCQLAVTDVQVNDNGMSTLRHRLPK